MLPKSITTTGVVFVIAAAGSILHPVSLAAQGETSAAAPSPLRTPWGHPDLGGVWDFSTNTPMERPPELKDKAERDKKEQDYEQRMILAMEIDRLREIEAREAEEERKVQKMIDDRKIIEDQIAGRPRTTPG